MNKPRTIDTFAYDTGLDWDEAEGILRPLLPFSDQTEED